MSDRHTNSGPGEGELTTEDLARSGRDSRPDSRSGPLSDTGRDAPSEARSGPLSEATGTRSGAPSDTGHDAPSEARSGPLSGARADRTPDTPPPAYPGEATAAAERSREPADERNGAPEGRPDHDRSHNGDQPRSVDEGSDPLIAHQEAQDYRERWAKIQGTFVDDPKDAVRSADALVADVIQSLAATFADHKKDLEGQWSRGEQVETEGLRVALQQYRTFFNQLLDA
ncbi:MULTISPECIES: hypothetical protein [unclassified Streptomyces]|uniref:hypothetical protein n=1 Tax=unclassified Streptomyces TaxID=2593676 RepID=UPI002E2DDE8A|nr:MULTISPECIES: hypothetical protein [unclassified Streptomyces]WUB89972.1 hypothetical protein OG812_26715 [Streptomyces sp. NBC_00566]